MRLTFKMEGGLAAFPGLSGPVTVDTDSLPPDEARSLEQLVEACRFFEQPSAPPVAGGPDARTYTLAIEQGGRSHSLSVGDPVPEPVRPLFERSQALARGRRSPSIT